MACGPGRASAVIRTAQPQLTAPWECVVRSGDSLRCYIGRVHEPSLLSGGEYQQVRFARKVPVTVKLGGETTSSLQNGPTSNTSGGLQIKTGSCLIYQKNAFGRTTFAQAITEVHPDKGYAQWPQGLWGGSATEFYVVLHRVADPNSPSSAKWCLSLILSADVTTGDIKIACVTKGQCVQIWSSDLYVSATQAGGHPFKVTHIDNTNTFGITFGTVNGKIPFVAGTAMNTAPAPVGTFVWAADPNDPNTELSYVYLEIPVDGTVVPAVYPSNAANINVVCFGTPQNSTNNTCYMLVAAARRDLNTLTNYSVWQSISASLWTDRIKIAGADARYYFARV